ncbi:MAG: hypothetical protein HFH42_01865 [Lachnospiraceae bacterium]|nr:hypothetical protein [Lachnospiraceae bacterium]
MTKEELRTAMETELAWRQEELTFMKNQLSNISEELLKEKYRKSLVLMLYAHFEGFVKICLLSYIQYVNSLHLKRECFQERLIASSMNREFTAFDNNDEKCSIFKRKLPDDKRLHRLYRRVNFLEELDEFKSRELVISDETIDTESNLWYIVLQKNLYKVGLPVDLFEDVSKDVDALVNRRNSIAHGTERAGVTEREYLRWETKTYRIMEDMVKCIYHTVCHEKYRKEH